MDGVEERRKNNQSLILYLLYLDIPLGVKYTAADISFPTTGPALVSARRPL
jgi:hypothetical protein